MVSDIDTMSVDDLRAEVRRLRAENQYICESLREIGGRVARMRRPAPKPEMEAEPA